MVKCADCGKEISKDGAVYCDICGAPLCKECGATGLCSHCTELWIAEIDLEDMEVARAIDINIIDALLNYTKIWGM